MKRGIWLVLFLVGGAVLFSVAALVMLYIFVGQPPRVEPESTLVLRPGGQLLEVAPDDVLQLMRGRDARTVRGYVDTIRKAARDTRITALVLHPRPIDSPFWAKVQELREAVLEFRASGKPVVAYLESGGDREYYLASAADQVYLLPTATLDLTGVASYQVFLRGTLDWIGTYPDLLHIGDYKTAVNVFTERTFTPAHREMTASLNRDQYDQLVRAIADARQKPEAEVRAIIDQGPLLAEDAVRLGLVDDLAYEDELDDLVPALEATRRQVGLDAYAAVTWEQVGVERRARIAVINAVGAIVSGRSQFDPINGPVLGSETIVSHIRDARADRSIRAIVLRVDSPGGSSTASDVIWRELMISKSAQRPLVVSMSDLAASGGYYISMPADVIVAQPGTLTGSIGIYSGKFVTGGTLEKLGANVEAVSDGAHAEMLSPDRPFTDGERQRLRESIQAFYDQFVEKAADSRHTTPEKIDDVAQGRVWTGQQARHAGLVDQLGGLFTAVAVAKQRARIPADEEVELVVYPPRRSVYEVLSEQFEGPEGGSAGDPRLADALVSLLGPRDRQALAALLAPSRLFRSGELLAHMPYVFVR